MEYETMKKSGEFHLHDHSGVKHRHYVFTPSLIFDRRSEFPLNDETSILLNKAYQNLGKLDGMSKYIPDFESMQKNLLLEEMFKSCSIDKNLSLMTEVMLENLEDNSVKQVWNCYHAIEKQKNDITKEEDLMMLYDAIVLESDTLFCWDYRGEIVCASSNLAVTNMQQYNPPLPEIIPNLMTNLFEFMMPNNEIDILIKSALIYYQFETIRPFKEANGKTGRLLSMLFLMQNGVISKPLLFMSNFLLEFHKDCLGYFNGVQHFSEYDDWIIFYLRGIIESTNRTILQIEQMVELRQKNNVLLQPFTKSVKQLMEIIRYIERKPVFGTKEIADSMKINFGTAKKGIDLLLELKIIVQLNQQSRYKLFSYQALLDIVE